MPLELVRLQEWTPQHQPTLIAIVYKSDNSAVARHANDIQPHPRTQHVFGQDFRNKAITRAFARRFVTCGDCDEPRVIYSDTASRRLVPLVVHGRVPTIEEETACQALVEEAFKEACASDTYAYGSGLYDSGHPFKYDFTTKPT
jgi:hypothetical protein